MRGGQTCCLPRILELTVAAGLDKPETPSWGRVRECGQLTTEAWQSRSSAGDLGWPEVKTGVTSLKDSNIIVWGFVVVRKLARCRESAAQHFGKSLETSRHQRIEAV